MPNILVVDDDAHIMDVISFALNKAGHTFITAKDGKEALEKFAASDIDLVILDVGLPEIDGLEVCRQIRKTSELPILFLSARDDEIDRILGLEIGGDDYVTKPFSPRELVARINAILKRTQGLANPTDETNKNRLVHGKLILDNDQHGVWWNADEVSLTATEFAILAQFMRYPTRVFSRDSIMSSAYQFNIQVSDRTIDSHIRHIRSKFAAIGCDNIIETVHSVGYKLSSCQ